MPECRTHLAAAARARLAGVALAWTLVLAALAPGADTARAATPLDGNGMWIWYVSRSGGTAEAIAKKANKRNIDTVMIKSADAGNYWEQFSPQLVDVLHDAGLQVCAWQFVYGNDPTTEARRGADAVDNGADCLLIDAESHYEGRYRAADRYIEELRRRVGNDYPVGLASFPYVDFHPSFPYSVFLGEGAAQFNVPQMYWRTIGTSVRKIYEHTYRVNAPYDRPIFPLGQTYLNVSRKSVIRFRKYARRYDAAGVSWWSWQETKGREWRWVGKPLGDPASRTAVRRADGEPAYPVLRSGDAGDLVVWAQQHLAACGQRVEIDGVYDAQTAAAVRAFQAQKGLQPGGSIDARTWRALLAREPDSIDWSSRGNPASARPEAPGPPSARTADSVSQPGSESFDALRFEVPITPGRP
jgi:Putative peptidoglycan binding domain